MPVASTESLLTEPAKIEYSDTGQIYSATAIEIAETMQLLPLLHQLARLEANQDAFTKTNRVRQRLLTRLQLATLEVSSLVAELECEVHRADEVQDRLKNSQERRRTSQTLLSVILGGFVNVVTGGFGIATGAGNTAHIVSIAGGTMEVLFGTSANFTKVRQEFRHPHNHLAKIWTGEESPSYFSPSIWRFLTKANRRDLGGQSLRDVLLRDWQEEDRLGKSGSEQEKQRIALILGTGGIYDADDLHIREAMLYQLESVIELMHQEQEILLREVLIHQAAEDSRNDVQDTSAD